ncbi:hypothetical protein SLS62_004704 [Diatrype stigma]|uniref:Major facilitator superfamily (MFS) profile domain-containing protein n=1 Tax=Diatrype stigma TaxID=117547 RepID=A0AAN9V4N0_9PEZI
MGGGTSIWASPEWRSDPREIFNWKLFYLTTTVAFAGCAYGFDQGNIGGVLTLPSFRRTFGLDLLSPEEQDAREGNIAAMSGSAGALIAAPCADFLGRKESMILYSFLFIVGATMQEIAHLGVFYAGRLIAGLAIGGMSMLAPQYAAENAPKSIRGSLTTSYNLCIILALSLAFWTNYGVSLWSTSSDLQWKLALVVINTPRALIAKGKREVGLKKLCELRKLPSDHDYVRQEYMEICAQVDAEQELAKGTNYWIVIKDIVTIRSNTRRFFLATTLFLFHKFTGTDSLNYFAPEIFEMIGVPAGSLSLLTTGVRMLTKRY